MSQLNNKGIQNLKDVFFVDLDTFGNLYVSRGIEGTEKHGQYGRE